MERGSIPTPKVHVFNQVVHIRFKSDDKNHSLLPNLWTTDSYDLFTRSDLITVAIHHPTTLQRGQSWGCCYDPRQMLSCRHVILIIVVVLNLVILNELPSPARVSKLLSIFETLKAMTGCLT